MRVSELWDRHRNEDIYVVGTGPSMRFFPKDFLSSRVTIGLNQAWRYAPMMYSVTIHPELIPDEEEADRYTKWIVKCGKPPLRVRWDDPRRYAFEHVKGWNDLLRRDDKLFVGRGIHQTAMQVAINMGARSVILVGTDMGHIGNEHHGHDQHVELHGLKAKDVYREYREWAAKARRILYDRYGVPIISMSPFLGLYNGDEDAERISKWQNISRPETEPVDVSTYRRKHVDKP